MGINERLNPFAKQNRPPPSQVLDARSRVVEVGDEVILNTVAGLPLFKVRSITPVMDPKAPPGLLMVDVVSIMRLMVQPPMPSMELILTQKAPAAAQLDAAKTDEGQGQPAEVPSEVPAVPAPEPDGPRLVIP